MSLDALRHALDDYVPRLLQTTGVPGLSVAVDFDGDHLACAYGYADRAKRRRMTPRHAVRVGSLAKPLVGVVVMQEVQAGRLDLDTPLAELVGGRLGTNLPGEATLRQALLHMAGLRTDIMYSSLALPSETTDEEALRMVLDRGTAWEYPDAPDRPLWEAKPGERYAYSNLGLALAAFAAQCSAGVPYPELVRTRVLEPAGMANSHIPLVGRPLPEHVTATLATGYMLWRGEAIPTPDLHLRIPSSAGLITTPADCLRLFQALDRDGLLLRTSTREAMLTPGARGTFLTDAAEAIALGFHWRDEDGPRPWVGQVGQYSFGWASEVRRYPHSGLTVSTAQNGLDVTRYVQPLDRSPFGLVAGFVATWCHDGPHQRPTHPLVWQHGYVAGLRVADRITGLAGCGPISDAEVERMVAGAQRAGTEWAQGFRAAIGATRGIAGDPAAMRDFIAHQAPVPAPLMALDMLAAGGSRAEFGPQTFFTR